MNISNNGISFKDKISFWFRTIYIFYIRKFIPKKLRKHLLYKKMISVKEEDSRLFSMLEKGTPFFLSRLGDTEQNVVYEFLKKQCRLQKTYSRLWLDNMTMLSGIFPNTEDYADRFSGIYLSSMKNVTDFCYLFPYHPFHDYLIKHFSNPTSVFEPHIIYPPFNNWPRALKGKKVLVIHPFQETIESQYIKRELLFKDMLLEDFQLITYKSVVSFAGEEVNYKTWEDALYKMFDDVKKIDFDVCLLGCGAYGLPLGSLIYGLGNKQVIHIGGPLQLLFGIKGKWYVDNLNELKPIMNDYWVYPSNSEKPSKYKSVESGSYW